MIKRVSHLGVAVRDLDAAVRLYRDVFGLELERRWTSAGEGMEAAAFRVGDLEIELMQPLDDSSPVGRFIARRGEGLHHVAYAVDDVAGALQAVEEAGVEVIDRTPRPGGEGKTLIGFLHPKSVHGVLTELEQDAGLG